VVFVIPLPVAVTTRGKVPVGVEAVVVMVKVVEQVGLQVVGENKAVAPVGRPATE
jgi:hypothetical protein